MSRVLAGYKCLGEMVGPSIKKYAFIAYVANASDRIKTLKCRVDRDRRTVVPTGNLGRVFMFCLVGYVLGIPG